MKKTILYFAVAVILVALSLYLDDPVRNLVFSYRPDWLVKTARWASKYGDWIFLMLGCLPFLVAAIRCGNDNARRLILTMMIVSSLAGLSADIVRAATGRARPNSKIAPGWYGVWHESHWLIIDTRYNSFPSGHTAAAMGLVAPLLLLRRRSGWMLLPLAVVISASRLELDAHHFSDVLASTLLAFGVALWWMRHGHLLLPEKIRVC